MQRTIVLCLAATLLSGVAPLPVLAQESKPAAPPAAAPAPVPPPAPAPAAPAVAPPAAPAPTAPAPTADAKPDPAVNADMAKPDEEADKRRREEATDRKAMFEARLAALHAGLLLTPEQEKMWPGVESAIRGFVATRANMADQRSDQRQDMDDEDWRDDDPLVALKAYSDGLLARGNALKAVADSAGPLWDSMTDEQKHRLPKLLREMNPRREMTSRHEMDRPRREGRGREDWHRPPPRWERDLEDDAGDRPGMDRGPRRADANEDRDWRGRDHGPRGRDPMGEEDDGDR